MIGRLCPHCDYTIMERNVNNDGTVIYVCPECGWTGSYKDLNDAAERGQF